MEKEYVKAHKIYKQLLETNPENVSLLFQMAELFMQQGNIKEAEIYTDEIIKRSGNHVNALYFKSLILSKNDNKEDALLYLERTLESDEKDNFKTNITEKVATEPEFKKYYNEEAFQRILYKYNIRLKPEE